MITYDKQAIYVDALEEALDLLHPVLRNSLDTCNIAISLVPAEQTFVGATRDPDLLSLDRQEQRGVVNGAYSHQKQMLVLRPTSALIVAKPLPAVLTHEAVHCLDFLRGDGKPSSMKDATVLRLYKQRLTDGMTISAYSKVSPLEFCAEASRAILGFSLQPVGRTDDCTRLQEYDPEMASYIATWFNDAV